MAEIRFLTDLGTEVFVPVEGDTPSAAPAGRPEGAAGTGWDRMAVLPSTFRRISLSARERA